MPTDYNKVREEWLQHKEATKSDIDLGSFAKLRDYQQGTVDRTQAYDDNFVKQANAAVDRFFAPIGEPIGRVAGRPIDVTLQDYGINTNGAAEAALAGTPRALAEFAPFIGWAGKGLTATRALAGAAGMASAGAQTYSATDSVPAGLLGAASLPLTMGGVKLGEKAAAGLLTRGLEQELLQGGGRSVVSTVSPVAEKLATFLAGDIGGMAAGEVSRQSIGLATGEGLLNPFTAENIVSNVAGSIPGALLAGKDALSKTSTAEVVRVRREALLKEYDTRIALEADAAAQRDAQIAYESRKAQTTMSEIGAKTDLMKASVEDPNSYGTVEEILSGKFDSSRAAPLAAKFEEGIKPGDSAEIIQKLGPADVQTTDMFTQLVRDVNAGMKRRFDESIGVLEEGTEAGVAKAARLRDTLGIKGIKEETTKQVVATKDVFNPDVVAQLEAEGRLPQITPEALRERFGELYERGVTGQAQEAYWHLVQEVINLKEDSARAAQAIKAREIQARAEVDTMKSTLTMEQRVQRFAQDVPRVPTELREAVQARAGELSAELPSMYGEGGRVVSRASHYFDVVNEALANHDPATGMTEITVKGRVGAENAVKERMPLSAALLKFQPKVRPELGEERAVSRSTEGLPESQIEAGLGDALTTPRAEPPEVAKARQMIADIRDPGKLPVLWDTVKGVFGRLTPEQLEKKRRFFNQAVDAQLSNDPKVAYKFAEDFAGRKLNSREARIILADYWQRGSAWAGLTRIIRDRSMAGDQALAQYAPELNKVFVKGTPQELEQGVRSAMVKHFRHLGYAPDFVNMMADRAVAMVKAFKGIDDMKFMELQDTPARIADLVTEQMAVLGLHGNAYVDQNGVRRTQPFIALAIEHAMKDKNLQPFANFFMVTAAGHEAIHRVQNLSEADIQGADPDLRLRGMAYKRMYNQLATMTQPDRLALLENVLDTVVPKEIARDSQGLLKPYVRSLLLHGAMNPGETIAMYGQMYLAGVVGGDGTKISVANMREALRWETPDVQMFIKGMYRDVADFQEGLIKFMEDPQYRQEAGLPLLEANELVTATAIRSLHDGLSKIIKPDLVSIRAQADAARLDAVLSRGSYDALADTPEPRAPLATSDEVQFLRAFGVDVNLVAKGRIHEAITDAHTYLTGKKQANGKKVNGFIRMFAPFVTHMAETKSDAAMGIALELTGMSDKQVRLSHAMLQPFMVRNERGLWVVDPQSPLHEMMQGRKSGKFTRSHAAVNKIELKLQEMLDRNELDTSKVDLSNTETLFQQAMDQNPTLREELKPILMGLGEKDRAVTVKVMNGLLQGYRNASLVQVEGLKEHAGTRISRVLQTLGTGGDWRSQLEVGYRVIDGVMRGDQMAVSQALRVVDPKHAMEIYELAQALVEPIAVRQQEYDARPFFMSEQRMGSWIVETRAAGEQKVYSADNEGDAKRIAGEAQAKGETMVWMGDKQKRYGEFAGDLPYKYAEKYSRLEAAAFSKSLERIRMKYGDTVAQALQDDFTPIKEVQKALAATGMGKYELKRKLVGGREDLDAVRQYQDYVGRLSYSASAKSTRDRVGVMRQDPALQQLPEVVSAIDAQTQYVMSPNSQALNEWRTIVSGYFLGANVGSMFVEGLQGLVTLVPYLARQGDSTMKAYGRFGSGVIEVGKLLANPKELEMAAARMEKSFLTNKPAAANDEVAYYFRKFRNEHQEGGSVFDDLSLASDRSSILTSRNIHGNFEDLTVGQLARNGLYQTAKLGLKAYGHISGYNSKVSFITAFRQAQEKGLHLDAAYDYARTAVFSTQFGGGRANHPSYVARLSSSPTMRPIIGMMHTLQQYSVGFVSSWISDAKAAFFKDTSITPAQRKDAWRAFGIKTMTQMALAGGLGMPFTAATLAVLEKVFGIEANRAIREGLASLAGDDEELGAMISEVALNGAASQLLGIDVAGRTGLSNLLGTSSYSGFNLADLAGPAPAIAENFIKAAGRAIEGEPIQAARELLPQTMKNTLEMADSKNKYGSVQFMDKSNNMIMEPTQMEALAYSLGLKPTRLREYQQASRMMESAQDVASKQRGKVLDEAARSVLQGDQQRLFDTIESLRADDPALDPAEVVRSVIERSIDMATPRDLLAAASTDRASRRLIARAFPGVAVDRQSEVQRLRMKDQALQALGFPYGTQAGSKTQYQRAALIDQLVAERGLSRSEAAREVELLMSKAQRQRVQGF